MKNFVLKITALFLLLGMAVNLSGCQKLNSRYSSNICVVGDWIFYIAKNDTSMLEYRKMRLDG